MVKTEKDIIEEILEEAWEEHRNTSNFGTYDTEGINNLVRIAIKKSIQSQKQKIIEEIEKVNMFYEGELSFAKREFKQELLKVLGEKQ